MAKWSITGWGVGLGVVSLALGGCASSPDTADTGLHGMRPPDCELVSAGYFYERRSGQYASLSDLIRRRGYDATRNVRAVRELIEVSPGDVRDVIVAWEGEGLRWNAPACRAP